MNFAPTADKLIPDLSPRQELVVLARALWREGYNDHLAGHITVNLGDGTLLCNPWLLTWAELRPSQVLRIDLEGRVVEGDWPVPLGIPLHLEMHKLRTDVVWAVHNHPLYGTVWADMGEIPPDPGPELGPRWWGAGAGERVRRARQRPGQRPSGRGADGIGRQCPAGRPRRLRPRWIGPGRPPAGRGPRATLPAGLARPGGGKRGPVTRCRPLSWTSWRPATGRVSSASGRRPSGPSCEPIPVCSTEAPAPDPPATVSTGTHHVSCPTQTALGSPFMMRGVDALGSAR